MHRETATSDRKDDAVGGLLQQAPEEAGPAWQASLPEQSPDAILRLSRDGRVLYLNPSARAAFPGALAVGSMAPAVLVDAVARALDTGALQETEIESGDRWLSVKATSDGRVANVYARDVTDRKQAERALRECKSRFHDLFSSLIEGFAVHEVICGPDGEPIDFRYLEVNPAFERLTGLGREIIGKTHRELYPAGDPALVRVLGAVALTREPVQLERYAPALGRWYRIAAFSPAQGRFATLFDDVTERKQAEQALREGEARFRSVLEGTQDLVYRFNLQTGRYEYISRSAESVIGHAADELMAMGPGGTFGLIHPDDLEHFRAGLARLEQEGRAHLEFRSREKSGEYRWLSNQLALVRDASGRPLHRDGSIRDITQRKRMEEELRGSEARFRQLAEAVPQIVFEVGAEGRRGYFNRRFREYTGLSTEDLAATADLIHPEDRERVRAAWTAAVRTGSPYQCEFRFRRKDGQYRWFLSHTRPLLDENGAVEAWVGSATDVHELKLAQDVLYQADQRKTEFLAVLSHELRNPLSPIKNCLHVLDRVAPGSEQARRARAIIGRQVDHLASLVNDLLDVSRVSMNKVRLQKELLDLNETVRRTVEDNRSLFEKSDVRLELVLSTAPVAVRADRTRVAQVVGNLLQNAAKFTAAGGRARVTVEAAGDWAKLRVADDGVGIAAATLERLFQPFAQARQTLDRSAGGLGIGLALVKGLVELHGGRVAARSEGVGTGAEFLVELPREPDPGASTEHAARDTRPPRRRVLIIEDNADAAESLRQVLELEEHEVVVAAEGAEGIRRARELRPDVVLCDIGLPGMDGYAVARALRADDASKRVHLIALSGYALPEDVERAAQAGFDGHLAKPPSLERLQEMIGGAPGGG